MWTLAVHNSDELIYLRSLHTCSACRSSLEVFPLFEPLEQCMIFKDIFPELSTTLVIFQDFPGHGIFKKKIPEAWVPWFKEFQLESVQV